MQMVYRIVHKHQAHYRNDLADHDRVRDLLIKIILYK